MNNRQKVLDKIVKQDLRDPWVAGTWKFRKTRIMQRKATKDLNFGELITYKNLGVELHGNKTSSKSETY